MAVRVARPEPHGDCRDGSLTGVVASTSTDSALSRGRGCRRLSRRGAWSIFDLRSN